MQEQTTVTTAQVDELTMMFARLVDGGLVQRRDLVEQGHTEAASRVLLRGDRSADGPTKAQRLRGARPLQRKHRRGEEEDDDRKGSREEEAAPAQGEDSHLQRPQLRRPATPTDAGEEAAEVESSEDESARLVAALGCDDDEGGAQLELLRALLVKPLP